MDLKCIAAARGPLPLARPSRPRRSPRAVRPTMMNGNDPLLRELRDRTLALHVPLETAVPRPSFAGYLRYLEESRVVFHTFEELSPRFGLHGSGMERTLAISADLERLRPGGGGGLHRAPTSAQAREYVTLLRLLAHTSPARFACHWYQWHFAWGAGGRLVGDLVEKRAGKLACYDYPPEAAAAARRKLEALAAGFSPEERCACVDEVPDAFGRIAALLALISIV